MPHPAPCELSDVLAILRLSHKYDIQYLHRRALDHLSIVYPTELAPFLSSLENLPAGFDPLLSSPEAHLRALRVIHEVNALWLLPSAYARASHFQPSRFFSTPAWPLTPAPIKQTLHTAHAHQARHVMAIVHATGREDGSCTAQPRTCAPLILAVIAALLEHLAQTDLEFNFFDVKDLFLPGVWDTAFEKAMCNACTARTAEQVSVGIQSVWDALPANMGLPPWEELRAMKTAVMR